MTAAGVHGWVGAARSGYLKAARAGTRTFKGNAPDIVVASV